MCETGVMYDHGYSFSEDSTDVESIADIDSPKTPDPNQPLPIQFYTMSDNANEDPQNPQTMQDLGKRIQKLEERSNKHEQEIQDLKKRLNKQEQTLQDLEERLNKQEQKIQDHEGKLKFLPEPSLFKQFIVFVRKKLPSVPKSSYKINATNVGNISQKVVGRLPKKAKGLLKDLPLFLRVYHQDTDIYKKSVAFFLGVKLFTFDALTENQSQDDGASHPEASTNRFMDTHEIKFIKKYCKARRQDYEQLNELIEKDPDLSYLVRIFIEGPDYSKRSWRKADVKELGNFMLRQICYFIKLRSDKNVQLDLQTDVSIEDLAGAGTLECSGLKADTVIKTGDNVCLLVAEYKGRLSGIGTNSSNGNVTMEGMDDGILLQTFGCMMTFGTEHALLRDGKYTVMIRIMVDEFYNNLEEFKSNHGLPLEVKIIENTDPLKHLADYVLEAMEHTKHSQRVKEMEQFYRISDKRSSSESSEAEVPRNKRQRIGRS